eukprot:TRINITY_DN71024_c0_g1_i1.p1 TRINITY_DN71024_c0_g1~~TRINITY_DN71024_c0_g1_i1.p1  ORF type:complete len:481 (+),score=123.60 TRINITY_DN71024_c0_g1_i1:79-1443(+)
MDPQEWQRLAVDAAAHRCGPLAPELLRRSLGWLTILELLVVCGRVCRVWATLAAASCPGFEGALRRPAPDPVKGLTVRRRGLVSEEDAAAFLKRVQLRWYQVAQQLQDAAHPRLELLRSVLMRSVPSAFCGGHCPACSAHPAPAQPRRPRRGCLARPLPGRGVSRPEGYGSGFESDSSADAGGAAAAAAAGGADDVMAQDWRWEEGIPVLGTWHSTDGIRITISAERGQRLLLECSEEALLPRQGPCELLPVAGGTAPPGLLDATWGAVTAEGGLWLRHASEQQENQGPHGPVPLYPVCPQRPAEWDVPGTVHVVWRRRAGGPMGSAAFYVSPPHCSLPFGCAQELPLNATHLIRCVAPQGDDIPACSWCYLGAAVAVWTRVALDPSELRRIWRRLAIAYRHGGIHANTHRTAELEADARGWLWACQLDWLGVLPPPESPAAPVLLRLLRGSPL